MVLVVDAGIGWWTVIGMSLGTLDVGYEPLDHCSARVLITQPPASLVANILVTAVDGPLWKEEFLLFPSMWVWLVCLALSHLIPKIGNDLE